MTSSTPSDLQRIFELTDIPQQQYFSKFDFLDWSLNFRDPVLQQEFFDYQREKKLYKVLLILAVLYSVILPTSFA